MSKIGVRAEGIGQSLFGVVYCSSSFSHGSLTTYDLRLTTKNLEDF